MVSKDKTKDKEHKNGETATSSETSTSPQDARQSNRDLSWDHNAQDAALGKTITEALTGEMAKADVHYQALLNDRSTATIQTSLKVTSGAKCARCLLLVSAVSEPFTSRLAVCICFSWFSRSEVCAFVLGNICERSARRDLC